MMVASKHMFLYGGRGLVTYFCAVGKSEETMDGCIRKAVECLPSHDDTHVKKMELSETIGVTLKDDVWCWATDPMVVAEVDN
jgi:hypothetical protein